MAMRNQPVINYVVNNDVFRAKVQVDSILLKSWHGPLILYILISFL